jgi:hypothetical protein
MIRFSCSDRGLASLLQYKGKVNIQITKKIFLPGDEPYYLNYTSKVKKQGKVAKAET